MTGTSISYISLLEPVMAVMIGRPLQAILGMSIELLSLFLQNFHFC